MKIVFVLFFALLMGKCNGQNTDTINYYKTIVTDTAYITYFSDSTINIYKYNYSDTIKVVMLISDTRLYISGYSYDSFWRYGYLIRSVNSFNIEEKYLTLDKLPIPSTWIIWERKYLNL